GVLKENVRGSISGRLIPCTGQERFSEKCKSLFDDSIFDFRDSVFDDSVFEFRLSSIETVSRPSPNFNAVSTESVNRVRAAFLSSLLPLCEMTRRSTTASMLCCL